MVSARPGPSSAKTPIYRPTILDVAKRAGVSRQTVTRAMNDMSGISVATKDRVLLAARTLGYRPSRYGRGLAGYEHRNLGLVVDSSLSPYYAELASVVVSHAGAQGWNVLLLDCSLIGQRSLLSSMSGQIDVLIGDVSLPELELSPTLPGVPVVSADLRGATNASCGVVVDHRPGLHEAVDRLLRHDVRHPVMLDSAISREPTAFAKDFVQIMRGHGIDPPIRNAGSRMSDGINATKNILRSLPSTDAIMCAQDVTAFGVLRTLREHGREVPKTVRVIGNGGLAAGTYVVPRLTSLTIDIKEIAVALVDIALGVFDGRVLPGAHTARRTSKQRLTIRESG